MLRQMKCVDVFHALHKCTYPGCLGQASTAWVISPLAYNFLQSLTRSDVKDDKYVKINEALKAKSVYRSMTAAFYAPSINLEEKLKISKSKNMNMKQVDFSKEQAGDIISEWANQQDDFKTFNIEKSIPADILYAVVDMSNFQGAWEKKSSKGRFMKIHNSFNYTQDINYEARIMELPTQDSDFRVIVLAPSQTDLLHTLFRRLTNEGLAASFASVQPLFSVDSVFTPPDIAITSHTNISSKERDKSESRIVQYGTTEINNLGVRAKVLSCLYSTKKLPPYSGNFKPEEEKAPYFFAITFKDTPIFTGQYIPKL
ncbi:serpin B4-like [Pectinophora gossypiella]|uniref:serpin B4-like n=1 Tax=Pectinophora gossypiella TaxID=13191 RepID=UPI00214F024A|nr:serpin B4-like [Pectinophora gossypiella]